jgi:hypothetical protein
MRILRFIAIAASFLLLLSPVHAQPQVSTSITDPEFWRLVTDFSEAGGVFPQQFMSNEDSAQFVIPKLQETTPRDGVYIGVGLEQNFTYIAAIRPRLAFVVDIRRDNMLEHLMYKSLFELSSDRAGFLSLLFSRNRLSDLSAGSSIQALFDAYQSAQPDAGLYDENVRTVLNHLTNVHKFPLTDTDKSGIARIMNAFRTAGPYTLKGQGDPRNPTYAQLMAATDLTGRNRSYLASEENFRIVQELQRRNLIVPLVGDFAGDKAIASIGRYLKERDAIVNVFYVSNVERYLFEQGDHGKRFYTNVAALPLHPSSTFIRSVTSDISRRLGIPIPDGSENWRSFLFPITDSLKSLADGRIQTYRELFEAGR